MTWEDIKERLRRQVSLLSEALTVWEDQKRPIVPADNRVIVLLRTFGTVGKGTDERVLEVDLNQPQGQELQDNVRGVRLFTLRIKVESYNQGNAKTADVYMSRVRDRWKRTSNLDACREVNVAFVRMGEVTDLVEIRDQHALSVGVLDVRLSYGQEERDPQRYGWIETVQIGEAINGNLGGTQYVHTLTRQGIVVLQ